MSVAAAPLAQLPGGVLLLCACALLSRRRLSAMITLVQVEAIALTAAALAQGVATHAANLCLTAALTLVIGAGIAPVALRRVARRYGPLQGLQTAVPVGLAMVLGAGLVGIAVLAARPLTMTSIAPARADLSICLSVVLLGLLVMTTCRHALGQVIGFLSLENGLMLAAVGMPGLPYVAELSLALPALAAGLVAAIPVLRIPEPLTSAQPASPAPASEP